MPLITGARIGPYEVIGPLGAGGMGEVYRARDARLGRDVAIKILPAAFASDPERRSRFEQEARAAAALNHPNIAVVHDVGVEGTTLYIVQEYLAGSSLRDVLNTQRSKPLREWIAIAAGIADALAAAHRAGIVHRDIKPENVIVTEDGRPKVLDFGLAKLAEPGADAVSSNSPTMIGTMAGAVLGTVGYMSPEQAAGHPADRRTDIFALGSILYEMIAGRRPFEGRSAAEIIAHVLHDEPPLLRQWRSDVPAELARVVHKCLQKDPSRRYQHADDLAIDLRESDHVAHDAQTALPATATPPRRLPTIAWIAIVVATTAAAVYVTSLVRPDTVISRPAIRFEIPGNVSGVFNRVLAVAPDGRFVARTSTTASAFSGLVVRWLDRLEDQAVDGAAGARDPAVSPDSRQIAFWANDQIKRVPVAGGPVVGVGPAPGRPLGLSWSDDGHIYFGRGTEGIWRIPAAGGSPQQVKTVGRGQYAHGPQLLPDHQWLIFTRASRVNGWNDAQIIAARLGSDEERVLVQPGHDARWVPGYLTYVHDSLLSAIPFDVTTRTSAGEPALLADGLMLATMDTTGAAFYDISESGVLAYVGGAGVDSQQMTWRENGRETPLPIAAGRISQVRLSPDGRRIAARVYDNGWHIYLYDVDRPTGTKVTSDGSNRNPVWTNDGEWVYYASDRNGGLDIWRRRADLGGSAELVYGADGNQVPAGITSDGVLLFITIDPNGSTIGKVDPSRPDAVTMLVDRPVDAPDGAVSRDGRFLAYQANIGGTWQVRVLELASGRQWTAADGFNPAWSPDGSTLLYQTANGVRLLSVSTSHGFASGADVAVEGVTPTPGCCDIAGPMRVLVLNPVKSAFTATVVVNWPELLRAPRR